MTTFNSASLGKIVCHYRAFLVDVFGVLRHETGAYRQAIPVIDYMQSHKKVVFFSNTADQLPGKIAERLTAQGFKAREDQVITSGMALAPVFAERNLVGKPVICVGDEGTAEYVRRAGGILSQDWQEAEASVLGFYITSENQKQFEAAVALALRRNKPALLANTDCHVPLNENELMEGPGVIGEAFRERTGYLPVKIGKPFPYMYKLAYEKFGGVPKEEILAIGDSLVHDVLGANNEGLDSLLVLSGLQGIITPASQLDRYMRENNLYPTYILPFLEF